PRRERCTSADLPGRARARRPAPPPSPSPTARGCVEVVLACPSPSVGIECAGLVVVVSEGAVPAMEQTWRVRYARAAGGARVRAQGFDRRERPRAPFAGETTKARGFAPRALRRKGLC